MKAFLLAAGKGQRLAPLTGSVPKCLVPIRGRPLLGIWMDLCSRQGVRHVLINTHHLARQVAEYLEAQRFPLEVTLVHEEALLGSARTVALNRAFVQGEDRFLILYADNLTDLDFGPLVEFHATHDGVLTMGVCRSGEPARGGVVEMDERGRIIGFEEKPRQPRSCWINAGVFCAGPALFDRIPDREHVDFGYDVLPGLVGAMYGYRINEYFLDIGTPEAYQRAQAEWGESFNDHP